MSVSIGHNLCYAVTDMGEIIGWGGQNKLFDTTADDVIKGTVETVDDKSGGNSKKNKKKNKKNVLSSEEKQELALSALTPRTRLLKGYGLHNTRNGCPLGSNKERRERRQRMVMPRVNETPSDAAIAKIRAIRSRGSNGSTSSRSSTQSIMHFNDKSGGGGGGGGGQRGCLLNCVVRIGLLFTVHNWVI